MHQWPEQLLQVFHFQRKTVSPFSLDSSFSLLQESVLFSDEGEFSSPPLNCLPVATES